MVYWQLLAACTEPRLPQQIQRRAKRTHRSHKACVWKRLSLSFIMHHVCHDEFIFSLAQRQSLRAQLPDILWLWFWTQSWLQSGWFPWWDYLLVWWIQPMPCMHSLSTNSAQSSALCLKKSNSISFFPFLNLLTCIFSDCFSFNASSCSFFLF